MNAAAAAAATATATAMPSCLQIQNPATMNTAATATATVSSAEVSPPYWVLLNMFAQVGKNPNKTTAVCTGRKGVSFECSLVRERPPLPSNLFVCCSGATFGEPPCLLSMVDNLILFHVYTWQKYGVPTLRTSDILMYRSDPKRPSLKVLSNPKGLVGRNDTFGIFPRGEDHYTIAVLIPLQSGNLFSLHLYDSKTDIWSWKKLYGEAPPNNLPVQIRGTLDISTVFTLGNNIGWVDLWRGIVFCDVLSEKHTLRGIPLPLKSIEHDIQSSKTLEAARYERGIAVINGCLRLVELGLKVFSDVPDMYDEETRWPCCQTQNWTITTWTSNSFDDWHMDRTIKASEIFLGDHSECGLPPLALQNLFVSDPTIGMNENGSEIIYLTARVKFMHPKSWVLAIDTRDCKVQSIVVRSGPIPQGMRFIDANYCPCTIYKQYGNASAVSGGT